MCFWPVDREYVRVPQVSILLVKLHVYFCTVTYIHSWTLCVGLRKSACEVRLATGVSHWSHNAFLAVCRPLMRWAPHQLTMISCVPTVSAVESFSRRSTSAITSWSTPKRYKSKNLSCLALIIIVV